MMVARRVEKHDPTQLELKLAYMLDPARRWQRYSVDAWIFVPRNLGLSRASYPRERFYEDTAAFVRIKTPTVALSALGDEVLSGQWFDLARTPLRLLLAGDGRLGESVSHRIKLLGCIYRRTIDDEAAAISARFEGFEELDSEAARDRAKDLARGMSGFAEELRAALRQLRTLSGPCEQAALSSRVGEVWRTVDEYVSLVAEEACTALVEVADTVREGLRVKAFDRAREALADAALRSYRYRRGRGYPSYVRPEEENEELPYRVHLLKRTVRSALYLQIREADSGRLATNVIGAVAAGLAMLFATLATLWAQGSFEMASLAFVGVAVVSYIIKDRIKEATKRALGRHVARYMPDKVVEVMDPGTGALLCRVQEAVSVSDTARVPAEIESLRNIEHPTATATEGRPETAIRYVKQVSLRSRDLSRRTEGLTGLNDIIRFNVNRLRARMEDPVESRRILDPETREVVSVDCSRVYHVNLVVKYTKGTGADAKCEVDRLRLVLDRSGIKRVERFGPSAQAAAATATAASFEALD